MNADTPSGLYLPESAKRPRPPRRGDKRQAETGQTEVWNGRAWLPDGVDEHEMACREHDAGLTCYERAALRALVGGPNDGNLAAPPAVLAAHYVRSPRLAELAAIIEQERYAILNFTTDENR